jgi:hypothetical protein
MSGLGAAVAVGRAIISAGGAGNDVGDGVGGADADPP